ncbi:metal-dependent hydrolase [Methanosarcina barkeri]
MSSLTIIGSILPDVIEPSRNKFHRKFFHSIFLIIIFVFLIMTYKELISGNFDNPILTCYFFIGCGSVSHLLMDVITRNGLPLTGL